MWILLKPLPLWKQINLLVCTYLLFLPVSPVYKFLSIYIPFWLWLLDEQVENVNLNAIGFGLLLMVHPYYPVFSECFESAILFIFLVIQLVEPH
jgi:hypothetical protein